MGEIADGVNALISLGRGDVAGAALSAASMVPVVGDAVGKGGKILRAGFEHGDEVVEAGTKLLDDANVTNENKVGANRPDLQWTDRDGKRHYWEIDRSKSSSKNMGRLFKEMIQVELCIWRYLNKEQRG